LRDNNTESQIRKRKIVVINQSSGYLFVDIVNAFCKEYDKVVLFAGEVVTMNIPLNSKVKVVHISKYNKKSTLRRSLSWIFGFIKSVVLLNLYYRDYEVFASSNPPLMNMLSLFCRNKTSLLIYDVYPDGLAAAGFIKKNSVLYNLWSSLNKRAFKRLQSITTITNGMATALTAYVEKSKIAVVSVWSNHDLNNLQIIPKENEFVNKFGFQNKFLVVYSGNLGMGYDLESLVKLADEVKENESIQILIIGAGYKWDVIAKLIENSKISNCMLLPYQSADLFLSMQQAMHVGVVSLASIAEQIAIPSKTFNILAAGKPIICLGSKESDLAKLIDESDSGKSFGINDLEEFAKFVNKMETETLFYDHLCANALTESLKYTNKNADLIINNHINGVEF
jgi:hypothetical protein